MISLFYLAGITVVAKGLAKPIQKDGVEYLQVDKILTRVRVSNAQIGFDDTERPLAGKYTTLTNNKLCSTNVRFFTNEKSLPIRGRQRLNCAFGIADVNELFVIK